MSARRVWLLHGHPQNATVRVRAVHSDDQRLMWLETWQDSDEPARRESAAEALHKVGQLIRRGARLMESVGEHLCGVPWQQTDLGPVNFHRGQAPSVEDRVVAATVERRCDGEAVSARGDGSGGTAPSPWPTSGGVA